MKRIFKVLLFVIMFCGISICSEATTTANVKLTANRDIIENGEQVEISLNIIGHKTVSYLAHIYFDDAKLEFISGPENIVVDKNHIKILWYDARAEELQQKQKNSTKWFLEQKIRD